MPGSPGRPETTANQGPGASDHQVAEVWSWELPEGAARPKRSGEASRRSLASVLVLPFSAVALVIWALSLPFVEVSRISGWGLLTALPLGWYCAYGLALTAVIVAASLRTLTPRLLIPALGSLLLILYATTSVTYGSPRYTWTYKHIGVTEYLLQHGSPALDVDIYQNFPGFFYVMGGLHAVTQIPLLLMARYAEVVTTAVNAVALYWTLGAITRSSRVRWVTLVIYTFTNWLGQTYFSPQAFVYPLSLLVIGILLRMISRGFGHPRRAQLVNQLLPQSSFWSSRRVLVILVLIFALVVCSHQFTPVALLLQVVALVVAFNLRRPWIVVVFGVIEALWLARAYPYISRHFSFVDFEGYDNIRPPAALDPVLPGAAVIAEVPHIITLFVALGTIAGAIRIIRSSRSVTPVLLPGVLAAAPAIIVLAQPYGQEGILRAYLFALPWCSFTIAKYLLNVDAWHLRSHVSRATIAVMATLGVLAVPAVLGNEQLYYIAPADVTADQWFETNTPVGSELLLLVPAYPSRSTANYDRHLLLDDPLAPALLRDVPGFENSTATGADLLSFTKSYVASRREDHDVYLAFGPTQNRYALFYGLVSQQAMDDYVSSLRSDPAFELVYDRGESYLFRAL